MKPEVYTLSLDKPCCLRVWGKLSQFLTLLLFFAGLGGVIVWDVIQKGSDFSTLPNLFKLDNTVQWQNADLKKRIIWISFVGVGVLYSCLVFWDIILYAARGSSPLRRSLKSLIFESDTKQISKSLILSRAIVFTQFINFICFVGFAVTTCTKFQATNSDWWFNKYILENLKNTNTKLAEYNLQPILFGVSALMAFFSIMLKMAFHISMWNTLAFHKNQNIGWFFRKQRRLSLLWNLNLAFAVVVTLVATAGIWGIFVNEKASEWLAWTKEVASFLKMEQNTGIEGAPAIFSISSSGLLFIVLVLNLIANATKGMAFVKKILRRGVQKAYELQQWNSIRTNLRIIETLQTISLICLLGFGGFMGLHIAGQKSILKDNIWEALTEEYQKWIMLGMLGLSGLLSIVMIVLQEFTRRKYVKVDHDLVLRDVKLGMVDLRA